MSFTKLPRSQNLKACLSYLKVLIQTVSIILIVLSNVKEKEKNPYLIATIMSKLLWV